ncbi:hypothetical protein [Legionella pneumophila]|uniref:Type IV secretion protein Dot n=1 Tax=Legionella pneumophila subsp. pascullei TaxID=91890 RepID=A0AAX2IXN3_LEGPN|nr:hypothetical protein [Legionella pneumophila]AMP89555.1 hypothetical protein AXF35_07650 [Legionella pneumophila subsp. pascullei]AMP92779.1 hypothetical protein AXF36_09150 [Legionella pneumophila subsp. pascullei]AMP95745.1 hypothetical protein AXF37_09040 [Legionella pneumophila subsp. pascullei]SQG90658.1 Uncharacterised protein [Legionella pneumophila subsp. pascullei]VEH07203.1 Uncharacterised protein [Legionella pneumophila subsp. pascullei]
MSQYTRLFEFLCDLIDIQIKKYVELAKLKVGEDGIINAALICEEVNELLGFAEKLLKEIETNSKSDSMDMTIFDSVFEQVKFYVEQEYLRSYAEWLLIENNSKETVYNRTKEQLLSLSEIKGFGDKGFSQPSTEIQQQCQHDSVQIVYSILNLAREVRKNPDMEFDDSIPHNKLNVLRRNATTRYIEFGNEIDKLHQHSEEFLQQSGLGVFDTELVYESAQSKAKDHELKLNTLLGRYKENKEITSAPQTISLDNEVDERNIIPEKKSSTEVSDKKNSFFSTSNLLFFGGVVLAAVIFVPRLLTHLKVNKL